MNIKPNLKDNTWEEVIYTSENNCIPDTWKVGDEIELKLSGKYNETVTLQIWDFDHYEKADGSGKAHILFGMKHLMKKREYMNTFYFSIGGWNKSYMRNTVMKNIYESIPEYIRNHIKEVNNYAGPGGGYLLGKGLLSKDKVFIPGLTECCSDWSSQNQTETGQKLFSIFSNNSRIKKMNNGAGPAEWWPTRSPYYDCGDYFCNFYDNGGSDYNYAGGSYGVCVCFNI